MTQNANRNTIELLGSYGGDLTHALSAWTSTSRELNDEKRERIPALLKMLATSGHHTVFEKSTLHFLVKCDTVTHYQFLKHRIGVSINTESARYKELKEDKLYVPSDWTPEEREIYTQHCIKSYEHYHELIRTLVARGVDRKRAKESARFILPLGNQLVMDVSFNFRSFMHFVGLRNKPDAQLEIRELAAEAVGLVADLGVFDGSLAAFGVILTPQNGNQDQI